MFFLWLTALNLSKFPFCSSHSAICIFFGRCVFSNGNGRRPCVTQLKLWKVEVFGET